jgi:hypothetical protein
LFFILPTFLFLAINVFPSEQNHDPPMNKSMEAAIANNKTPHPPIDTVSFLNGAASDDASVTPSINRKKSRLVKRKPTAKEQRDEILMALLDDTEMLRAQRQQARKAARRSIPAEELATAAETESNNARSERDVLVDGLNDRPATWEQEMEDEEVSSVEFGCMSHFSDDDNDDDDDISFNLNRLVT